MHLITFLGAPRTHPKHLLIAFFVTDITDLLVTFVLPQCAAFSFVQHVSDAALAECSHYEFGRNVIPYRSDPVHHLAKQSTLDASSRCWLVILQGQPICIVL